LSSNLTLTRSYAAALRLSAELTALDVAIWSLGTMCRASRQVSASRHVMTLEAAAGVYVAMTG